jgi:hypothetical protein
MLNNATKLSVSLATLLMASVASAVTAQPYGSYDRRDDNGYYTGERGYGYDRNPNFGYGSANDSRYGDRNRDPYGYEPPRIPGRTFNGNDQPDQRLTGTPGDDIFYAGHSSTIMTGGPGSDRFVFNDQPWQPGHITDFMPGQDILDLRPLFMMSNYRGNDPVREGYIQLKATDAGTMVYFAPNGQTNGPPWPIAITTLDNIRPEQVQRSDYLFR